MPSNNEVNLNDVRPMLLDKIQKLKSGTLTLDDFTEVPHDAPMYPSELQAEAKLRGVWNQIQRRAELEQHAIQLKREGNLFESNKLYKKIFKNEEKFDKPYIWSWCKVLILANNFSDLKLLLEYLHCFNVCFNLLQVAHNQNMFEYAAWGSSPEFDFDFDARQYLQKVCQSDLGTKNEVQQRFAAYGGSELWQENYVLDSSDYDEFLRCFGADNKINQSPTTTPNVATETYRDGAAGKSGCYIATYVYGSYDCPEVIVLRNFRDNVLSQHAVGRQFIRLYYAVSPKLVKWFGDCAAFHKLSSRVVSRIVTKVEQLNINSDNQ